MTVCRTRCVTKSFKFKRRNNIRTLRICIFIKLLKVDWVITCCYDNCTVLFSHNCFFLVEVDCACSTSFFTESTNIVFAVLHSLHVKTLSSVDICNLWNSLSKWNINCFLVVQVKVERIWNLLVWTSFDTSTTTCTFCFINITWVTFDIDREVTDVTLYANNF